MQMSKADAIREYVNITYIVPARAAGETQVKVRAGDVHAGMKLESRMPAVTSALGANVFEAKYRVKCVARSGPHNGAHLWFTFDIQP